MVNFINDEIFIYHKSYHLSFLVNIDLSHCFVKNIVFGNYFIMHFLNNLNNILIILCACLLLI